MKREAHKHPKTYDLAARLGVELPTAIGYLNLLLDFAADAAPAGNVGKWPDGAIARSCEWAGDPAAFTAALVASGWLDTPAEHRLAIHDISQHAPTWWKLKNRKLGIAFWDEQPPPTAGATAERTAEATAEATAERTAEATAERPSNLTKPNLTKPDRTGPDRTQRNHSKPSEPSDPSGPSDRQAGPSEPAGRQEDPFEDWPELEPLAAHVYPPQRPGRCMAGIFYPLRDAHLNDHAALFEWVTRQASAPAPLMPANAQAFVLTLAMADYVRQRPARAIRTNRIALFARLMGTRQWHVCRNLIPQALETYRHFKEPTFGQEKEKQCAHA